MSENPKDPRFAMVGIILRLENSNVYFFMTKSQQSWPSPEQCSKPVFLLSSKIKNPMEKHGWVNGISHSG